jgi:hypothetical protein
MAKALLDRFGIPWVSGAKYAMVQQYTGGGGMIGFPREVHNHTPEALKKKALEALESASPDQLKKVLEVLE